MAGYERDIRHFIVQHTHNMEDNLTINQVLYRTSV
jgi:hypothetical protein